MWDAEGLAVVNTTFPPSKCHLSPPRPANFGNVKLFFDTIPSSACANDKPGVALGTLAAVHFCVCVHTCTWRSEVNTGDLPQLFSTLFLR